MRQIVISSLALLLVVLEATAQETPQSFKPDAKTLAEIDQETKRLRDALAGLRAASVPDDIVVEVEVYLRAAESVVRDQAWHKKESGLWTQQALEHGLKRAAAATMKQTPWRNVPGRGVVRAYRSRIDGTAQPYGVALPHDYGKDPLKKWRLDVELHGRSDQSIEIQLIKNREGEEAAKGLDRVLLRVYGRGNNGFRWAGEVDVLEALDHFLASGAPVDPKRVVLKGFSMGGAGVWHIGLHHPTRFAAIVPEAGFTSAVDPGSRLKGPDYQARGGRIYEALDHAENVFHVPTVAYCGTKDRYNIAHTTAVAAALRKIDESFQFTHVVGEGLAHIQGVPPQYREKVEAELTRFIDPDRKPPERVRFVAYTARYGACAWATIEGLDRHYDRAMIDATWTADKLEAKTTNVRLLKLAGGPHPLPAAVAIDGQSVAIPRTSKPESLLVRKRDGKWEVDDRPAGFEKVRGLQGPIDDAFMDGFVVVPPTGKGWQPTADAYATASFNRFRHEWGRYMRGTLPVRTTAEAETLAADRNLVLFGDPESNPLIAKVLPKLPITWTAETLEVNGVKYDPKAHLPVLIYPNPLNPKRYVVINSGHTFHAADFQGSNKGLSPKLGDWAVLKPAPTAGDPAAADVAAAGLFDEAWQLPKR